MADSKWDAMVHNPEMPIAEYLEHEKALQEYEGEKLTRLKIMTRAQEIRTWFLKLSMANRKIFLDVLTSDTDGGAMARLFALQSKLEAKGVDDDYLAPLKPGVLAGSVAAAPGPMKRIMREQKRAKQLKQKMLTAGSPTALPPGRALALPGGKS